MGDPEVWIGLAEVVQRPGAGMLMDRNQAFVHVLAMARDEETFRRLAVVALGDLGFDCVEIEEPEPLEQRRAQYHVADDLLSLASEVRTTGKPLVGKLFTWVTNDE